MQEQLRSAPAVCCDQKTPPNSLLPTQFLHQKHFSGAGGLEITDEIRVTIAAEACKEVCRKALEACGGQGFMQSAGIESLLRDVMASHYHPLQEKRQQLFSGSIAMGKEPPGQAF